MTKVQTGTKEMLFIIIALSLGAGVFFFRRKNA
jgi:LPXTG-motif cell wall-anchored protein